MSNEHDRAILHNIFNPFTPVDEILVSNKDFTQSSTGIDDAEEDLYPVWQVKSIELEGVKAAERGDMEKAIELLTEVVSRAPQHASGFNNRAQAYRMMDKEQEALTDLDTAVRLSRASGRSGMQALCQRGLIHRKQGNTDAAKEDFGAAAGLGSRFAKAQLAAMNPYAALCNQMLKDVFAKLQTPTLPTDCDATKITG